MYEKLYWMYCLEVFENKYCIVLYAVVVDINRGGRR